MEKQIQTQDYRVFYTDGDKLIDNGTHTNTLSQLQTDFPNSDWTIIPVGEVPADWRDMTVIDGVLVLASAEVIAAREVTRGIAETEMADSNRKADYTLLTDPLWLEIQEDIARSQPDNPKCVAWLAKKDAIRLSHPKPNTTLQETE